MARKSKKLEKNLIVLKFQIQSEAQSINVLMKEKSRLISAWYNCFWLDDSGNLCMLDNDYEDQMKSIDNRIADITECLEKSKEEYAAMLEKVI